MQINGTSSLDFLNISPNSQENIDKIKEAASKIDASELSRSYQMQFMQQSFESVSGNFNSQIGLSAFSLNSDKSISFTQELKELLNQNIDITGYSGKSINELSQYEAAELVSENGYFGIQNTANRIADFVINGANGDAELLRSGLEGVKQGFAQAEEMWGQALPDISAETMNKTLDRINQAIMELSGNVVNVTA